VGSTGGPSTDGNRDSTIVEFTPNGKVLGRWDVPGKADGVTADPALGGVIVTLNEDGNLALAGISSARRRLERCRWTPPIV
jgi:hypothetical protein